MPFSGGVSSEDSAPRPRVCRGTMPPSKLYKEEKTLKKARPPVSTRDEGHPPTGPPPPYSTSEPRADSGNSAFPKRCKKSLREAQSKYVEPCCIPLAKLTEARGVCRNLRFAPPLNFF